jgi:hypothetical protein
MLSFALPAANAFVTSKSQMTGMELVVHVVSDFIPLGAGKSFICSLS